MPSANDWTAATDDLLLERLRTCTCCGRHVALVWANVLPVPLPVAVVLCQKCHVDPTTPDVLGALLQRRYGKR